MAALIRVSYRVNYKPSSSPPCISRSSTHDRQLVLGLSLVHTRILPSQTVLEHVSQELERNILESPSRSMPELEDILVLPRLPERGRLGMTKRRVRFVDDGLEVCGRDTRGRDEEGEDGVGELGKR
jgi:hypothetical protein